MNNVVLIRDRGQLTIPDNIRKAISWVAPSSAVSITVVKPNEIVIRPHNTNQEVDWPKLWEMIKLSRSFKGRSSSSLSNFIAKDRETRR